MGRNRAWVESGAGLAIALEAGALCASLEYYGEIPSVNVPPRAQPQVHQLFVGGDWEVKLEFSINMGLGFDLGNNGPGVVLKSRFEWDGGRTVTRIRNSFGQAHKPLGQSCMQVIDSRSRSGVYSYHSPGI